MRLGDNNDVNACPTVMMTGHYRKDFFTPLPDGWKSGQYTLLREKAQHKGRIWSAMKQKPAYSTPAAISAKIKNDVRKSIEFKLERKAGYIADTVFSDTPNFSADVDRWQHRLVKIFNITEGGPRPSEEEQEKPISSPQGPGGQATLSPQQLGPQGEQDRFRLPPVQTGPQPGGQATQFQGFLNKPKRRQSN